MYQPGTSRVIVLLGAYSQGGLEKFGLGDGGMKACFSIQAHEVLVQGIGPKEHGDRTWKVKVAC